MKIVVLGGGPAGVSAASAARYFNSEAEILLFSDAKHVAYSPCAIPFVIGRDIESFNEIIMHTPDFYEAERKIRVVLRHKVASINTRENSIKVMNRSTKYDAAVIATGSHFSIPIVKGYELNNIFTVKTIEDGLKIDASLQKAKKAVVFGAKLLGAEMSFALRKRGLKVTLVDENPQTFFEVLEPQFALEVQKLLEKENIRIVLNASIESYRGKDKVKMVSTTKGEIEADLVILATKTMPNNEIARNAGIKLNHQTGAISVDDFLQTSENGVYAAGDCAEIKSPLTMSSLRCKLGSTASFMGRTAGVNAGGGRAQFPKVLTPWVVPLNGYMVGGVGCTVKEAQNAGYDPQFLCINSRLRARYYPKSNLMKIIMVVDKNSKRVLGAQILSEEGVKERIDFLTYLIKSEATLNDLTGIENCYAPSVAALVDPIVEVAERLIGAG